MKDQVCEVCRWKVTGHGWQDHACWCIRGWIALDRELEKRKEVQGVKDE